ncbi:hypothetical protein Mucpa_6250 [Mucilaginibacter paludis DSM 18603]|uniref:Uncharacterized protein n=1 Tax=Mucilaginibacter paludis DSM 18603 TaxID=714943 RepID=H1Y3P4_9SPHI|nr:hypothetical protein Mucpa_6250 [Mucilaginibacter paludis DSM 18603]
MLHHTCVSNIKNISLLQAGASFSQILKHILQDTGFKYISIPHLRLQVWAVACLFGLKQNNELTISHLWPV